MYFHVAQESDQPEVPAEPIQVMKSFVAVRNMGTI